MTNKLGLALVELHRSENDLAEQLLAVSDRHKADHEIYHLARDLARWSQRHVRELAVAGTDYGLTLDPEAADDTTILEKVRQKGSELIGRHHEAALLLLHDLREVHLAATSVSLQWEIVAQTGQALKDKEVVALSKRSHPDTLRQMRWSNAMIKVNAAQVMVT